MTLDIVVRPLTAEDFASFGEVIEARGAPDTVVNLGKCARHHDRAELDFGGGRAGISVLVGQPCELPLTLPMMERHPLGSQAFLPLSADPFLAIVAEDAGDAPDRPRAFLTAPGQGVNYRRGVWHGVLAPLGRVGTFAVVDRIGAGRNFQEHWFETPWVVRGAEAGEGR